MSGWQIALLVVVLLCVYLDIKNRRERPVFEAVEKKNATLLEGRFQGNPVLRRRFMRALVRYCCTQEADRMAFTLAQHAARIAQKPEDRASCAVLIALNLERMEEYAKAAELYDAVLEIEPDSITALSRKARVLGILQEEGCVELFEEVIRRKPNDPVWHNNYGTALLRLQRFEEAEAQLRKAVELDDGMGSAWGLLAMAYDVMGKPEQREQAIAAAVARGESADQIRSSIEAFKRDVI